MIKVGIKISKTVSKNEIIWNKVLRVDDIIL